MSIASIETRGRPLLNPRGPNQNQSEQSNRISRIFHASRWSLCMDCCVPLTILGGICLIGSGAATWDLPANDGDNRIPAICIVSGIAMLGVAGIARLGMAIGGRLIERTRR